jgi:hypothetical protein
LVEQQSAPEAHCSPRVPQAGAPVAGGSAWQIPPAHAPEQQSEPAAQAWPAGAHRASEQVPETQLSEQQSVAPAQLPPASLQ